uniref:Uncharacterized protein n=1 Tax=Timema tahoe TaxID=61484 RepID=A0A7R9IJB5_9NEOP|nr:unnamed protein product [Timema tahoe]
MDRLDVLFARREKDRNFSTQKVQPTKNTQNNSSDIKLVQEICPTPGDKLEGEGETDLSSTPQGVPNIHCRSLLSVLLNNNHIGRLQNGVFTGLKELRYLLQQLGDVPNNPPPEIIGWLRPCLKGGTQIITELEPLNM